METKVVVVLIRIENHDVLPRQQRHVEFESVERLLLYLTDTTTDREVSISSVGRVNEALWVLCVRSDPAFLKLCQRDGVCGICGGKLDPEEDVPQFNAQNFKAHLKKEWIYCDYCGRKIGTMQRHSIVDVFYQSTQQVDAQYEFTPALIECGHCQGTGEVEVYDDEGERFDICPACLGERHIKIEGDLMRL